MKQALPDSCWEQLVRQARTCNGWTADAIDDKLLGQLYELLKFGPTSANSCPARFVWVRSSEGKAKLSSPARALGLDCGPMSGFDHAGVDREFFSGPNIKSNFIYSLGIGDPAALFPRNPRLSFEEAGRFA